MEKPRAYTEEEVIEMMMGHVRNLVNYWDGLGKSKKETLEGLVFSIFTMLDGSGDLPTIDLVLKPHSTDRKYHISKGANYFKSNMRISTTLHEDYCIYMKKHP